MAAVLHAMYLRGLKRFCLCLCFVTLFAAQLCSVLAILEYKLRRKKRVRRDVTTNADSDGNGCPLSSRVHMYESGCLYNIQLVQKKPGMLMSERICHVIRSLIITCPTCVGMLTTDTKLSPIPFDLSFPIFIYLLSFLLLAVIDRAIWRCQAFHHLWGCQWLGIKILYSGLIFQKFVFFITWPLHSTSLSTLPAWLLNRSLTSTPWELFSANGYMSRA